jgi:ferrochelatase
MPYDAILLVSFGGPEKEADVLPFLENVLRGKNVPRERMLAVADHYYLFGGKSPLNELNRTLKAELENELERHQVKLPVYWGNRNWHPLLPDTLRQMRDNGVRRALAFVTSAYSSYSGCRQYRENLEAARQSVGPGAPVIDKLRVFFNHPGFIEAIVDNVSAAVRELPASEHSRARLIFTAHSVPTAVADGSRYQAQLQEASRLVAERMAVVRGGRTDFDLVYQSRSGPPSQPWLEPDILDFLHQIKDQKDTESVVLVPIGFVSDHIEVLYDLDTAAKALCEELGLQMRRAQCPGTHPRFIQMIRELVLERMEVERLKTQGIEGGDFARPALGVLGPCHDVCPEDCCPAPQRITGATGPRPH